jgi:tetratricopeptide (TPR) repeat protein
MKDYRSAISFFQKALKEEYQPGTPFTDAQIYSNMGMAYSSIRLYQEAFNCLKKAQAMGLTNPSIERELLWLRNNVGLY